MNDTEVWRQIEGFGGHYSVSNHGRVVSRNPYWRRSSQVMTPCYGGRGYQHICFKYEGRAKTIKIHRLVALAFIPNPRALPEINHIDGNKINNRADNLEWCTRQENIDHAWAIGRTNARLGKDNSSSIPIICVETGTRYETIKQAAAGVGIQWTGGITRALRDPQWTARGYHWRYATEPEKQ